MRKLIKEANKHEIPSGILSDQEYGFLEIRNLNTPPPFLGRLSPEGAGLDYLLYCPVLPACVQTLQLAQAV